MDTELLDYLRSYLTERRQALFQKVLSKRTRHFTVVTEDVYQLHNTSAVMRSCDVFGIQDLHAIEARFGKKIDKEIAMGAQKWVQIHRYNSTADCIDTLRSQNYQIIATTPHESSQMLHDFDITKKSAFFFGTEKEGLSDEVMEKADGYLKIPMYGFTESLNISVSAAIILQNVVARLKQSDIDWRLSEEEKVIVETEWAKKTIKSSQQIIEHYQQQKKT